MPGRTCTSPVPGFFNGFISTTWMGNNGPDTWFANYDIIPPEQYKGTWIQYRLALGAKNSLSTPRIHDVRIGFMI